MPDESYPKMSVIILTPDDYGTIRRTMSCLRAQTVFDQLEIVIVAPSLARLQAEPELDQLANVRIVEIPSMESTAAARAAGVLAATAPLVVLAEDHSFPEPDWAEILIVTHRGPWAVVGPAIQNGNGRGALSWANLVIEYGPWLHPVTGGTFDHLPGHNSSYKRDLLLQYGSQLEAMLRAESVLHWDLRARGHRLYLEPTARTSHLNYSLLAPTITLRFLGGRLFAASRAKSWPLLRRLFYALASPLIPLIRLGRAVCDLRRVRQSILATIPFLIIALVSDALGEMTGYLFGCGDAMRTLSDIEFNRPRFMNWRDRSALGPEQLAQERASVA